MVILAQYSLGHVFLFFKKVNTVFIICLVLLLNSLPLIGQTTFNIQIDRLLVKDGLITGKLYVNGEYIGPSFENEVLKIEKGSYKGVVRYYSNQNFVSNPLGTLARDGDFLLEVAKVQNRFGLLFHAGQKPYHARGCVLLGNAYNDNGTKYLPIDHPLRILREKFYGTADPLVSPNKNIVIKIDESKLKNDNDSVNTSLLILIDVSGSMAGEKLKQAKASAKEAVKKALKSSRVEIAVLAFSGKCANPIHTAIGFTRNEKYLMETITRFQAEGGTPLAGALSFANDYMFKNKSLGSVNQMVILMADGDDDCGNLTTILAALAKKEIIFRHETIGLGVNDNVNAQSQLKSIATTTSGAYHNSDSPTELSRQFDAALENMRMLEMMGKLHKNTPASQHKEVDKNNNEINWKILKN